ncbi:MAG: hypothetical protein AB7Q37_15570 [Pyrinomonadaceae bacterium]
MRYEILKTPKGQQNHMRGTPTNLSVIILLIISTLGLTGCSNGTQHAVSLDEKPSSNAKPTPPVAQAETTPDENLNTFKNEVNGIAIGSTYDELIGKFGKPEATKKGGTNPCGGEKTVISYKGIVFHLDKIESDRAIVVLIEITSPEWVIAPGVSTGLDLSAVRAKMERLGRLEIENGSKKLIYGDGDGWLEFYFDNEKLVKIRRDLNQC